MNLYCIKCLMATKNNNTELKHKIDRKNNFNSCCIDCCFKQFVIIDEEEISDLLKKV